VPEARLEDNGSGLAPAGEGWFVVNVGDAQWLTSEGGEKQLLRRERGRGDVRPAPGIRAAVRAVAPGATRLLGPPSVGVAVVWFARPG
jgi:hypothetical protein